MTSAYPVHWLSLLAVSLCQSRVCSILTVSVDAPLAGKLPGKVADYYADIDALPDSRGEGAAGKSELAATFDVATLRRTTLNAQRQKGSRHRSEARLKMCK